MKPDREQLRAWYRQAMVRRADELRALRPGLDASDPSAIDAVRAVAQALRGSGASFGFPELTSAAALVESASDANVLRRAEGLIEHLRRLSGLEGEQGARSPFYGEWLLRAAGVDDRGAGGFADVASAWRRASELATLSSAQLAERAAVLLSIRVADLSAPNRAALRLLPEALMRGRLVLPIREDGETITVAAADPTSLGTEVEITRLTGREPRLTIAPPDRIAHALGALLDAGQRPDAHRRRVVAPPADGPEKVLVVDDDGSSRLLARTVLEKRGYSVVEAEDGVEALDRLRSDQPVALVVADLNMPQMDGLELLWEMRGTPDWSHIPVIVLTGETDEVLETRLIEEGADDYVCKPLDPRLFLARVGATIRRAEG